MTKQERLKLIREIVGKPVPGLIPVSEREVETIAVEEFHLTRKTYVEDENVIDLSVTSFRFNRNEY